MPTSSWGANTCVDVVREAELGLTPARLRGAREAAGDVLIFIDDDNLASANYIRDGLAHFADPLVGAVGGRSRPHFLGAVPEWLQRIDYAPGCNDAGDRVLRGSWRGLPQAKRVYPPFAPIGTGMMVRRDIFEAYASALVNQPDRRLLDRRGKSLASGGDNDIIITALQAGYDVVYDPAIEITHEIPAGRLTEAYVRRYAYETTLTWVQVLSYHGLSPWKPIRPWTAGLRKARAWLRTRPWKGPAQAMAWEGARGMIDGRARASKA